MPHVRCAPTRDSAEWAAFNFRPADPAWAPTELLARCRTALKAYDSHLDLWWSPMRGFHGLVRGRWRVVEFLKSTGNWDTCYYWEGPKGEYREPSPDALVSKLMGIDLWARGDDLAKKAERIDKANAELDAKKEKQQSDAAWESAHDKADYSSGAKTGFLQPAMPEPRKVDLILP